MWTSRRGCGAGPAGPLAVAVAVATLWLAPSALGAPRSAGDSLQARMKNTAVALVPPRAVHTRGESLASVRHNPLAGYVHTAYPEEFGELARTLLSRAPTRWQVTAVIPEDAFYDGVETEDPDGDDPAALTTLPEALQGYDFVAVVRYAEFAYGVTRKPHWTRQNQVVMEKIVTLELDLQMVVYDGRSGEPLGAFDALQAVEVPEIQPKARRTKAYYRATLGALRRLRSAVRRADRHPERDAAENQSLISAVHMG